MKYDQLDSTEVRFFKIRCLIAATWFFLREMMLKFLVEIDIVCD